MVSGANAFEISDIERMNIGAHQSAAQDVTMLSALLLPKITIRQPQVGIDLIDQNRSVLAAMPGEIALAVTVDIQPPNQASVLDRIFPHARVHGLTAPRNVTRKSNIY